MRSVTSICCFSVFICLTKTEESFCIINGKKALNYVSDKFISFAVDPTVLFSDLNISETAHELGKHLAPAYVRIAGPSTRYLKFSENEDEYQLEISENSKFLVCTPSFMDSLNEWFINTNLAMIFALNDNDVLDGKWNSNNVVPLFRLFAEIDSNCLWQLGYDNDNLTFKEYNDNLQLLKKTLNTFPSKKNDWGIISNELNEWSQTNFDVRKNAEALQNLTKAILWGRESSKVNFLERDEMEKLLSSPIKPKLPVWAILSKSKDPVTFSSTLTLAKQIGEAAVLGYEIIFKQPRVYELMADTSNYWFITFHKHLMGRNVLDIKTNGIQKSDANIYAHCTRNQNNFSRRGAITICIVNDGPNEYTISIKLPTNIINLRQIEVQSYILTSDSENSTNVYSNHKRLTIDLLRRNQVFAPKVRRARINKHLSLIAPPKSIGFFTLPDARIPICINDEDETNLIMEDIEDAPQSQSDRSTHGTEVKSRIVESTPTTLSELYNEMRMELEIDKKFYRNPDIAIASEEYDVLKIDVENERVINKIKEQTEKYEEKHLGDTTSQEIEDVVLQIIKNIKEKVKRNGTSARIRRQNSQLQTKRYQKKSRRDINMELLKQKSSKDETVFSKLEGVQSKPLLKQKELGNKKESPKRMMTFQETLEELLKPKPLDLSEIFHLRKSEKLAENKDRSAQEQVEEIKDTEMKGSVEYLDEQQDDYLEDLNLSLHHDLESYPDFYKEIEKDVKVISRNDDDEADGMLNNTFQSLENYLNNARDARILDEEDLDLGESILGSREDYLDYGGEFKIRKKRDEKDFTEEDIVRYRQLMNSNIRHMRDNIRKNKLKLKITNKEQVNLGERINRLRQAVEVAQKSGGKEQPIISTETVTKPAVKIPKFTFDKVKIGAQSNAKLNNAKLLKSRLAQHKLNQNNNGKVQVYKNEGKNKPIINKKEDIDDETKQLITMIKSELRNRKPRHLQSLQKEYAPNVKLEGNIRESYKPMFGNVNLKAESSRRFKRYITKGMYGKYDDTINSINEIVKDGDYFIPKLATNSDFTHVLPTNEEIALRNTEDAYENKLKKKTIENSESESSAPENALPDHTENVTDQFMENKELVTLNSSVIQKGEDVKSVSADHTSLFDKFFDVVFSLIVNIREKMKNYLNYLDD